MAISGVLGAIFGSGRRRTWLVIVVTAILMFQVWLWVETVWTQFDYAGRFALFGVTFLLLVLISWERVYIAMRKK